MYPLSLSHLPPASSFTLQVTASLSLAHDLSSTPTTSNEGQVHSTAEVSGAQDLTIRLSSIHRLLRLTSGVEAGAEKQLLKLLVGAEEGAEGIQRQSYMQLSRVVRG